MYPVDPAELEFVSSFCITTSDPNMVDLAAKLSRVDRLLETMSTLEREGMSREEVAFKVRVLLSEMIFDLENVMAADKTLQQAPRVLEI